MRPFFVIVAVVLLFASCERKTEWNIEPLVEKPIVVDGILTNERKAHEVRLTRVMDDVNAALRPVAGAIVTIDDADSVYLLEETPPGSGIYQTDSTFQGVTGKAYHLEIFYQGKMYAATASMVPVILEPLDDVAFTYDDSRQLYRIVKINPVYSSDQAMYEVLLDWSHVAGYGAQGTARLLSFAFNTLDVGQVFPPEKEKVWFPAGTIVIVRKYSLTDEFAAYLRALAMETQWHGGYFDEASANLPTNLSAGAIGYFAASSVLADTLIVAP